MRYCAPNPIMKHQNGAAFTEQRWGLLQPPLYMEQYGKVARMGASIGDQRPIPASNATWSFVQREGDESFQVGFRYFNPVFYISLQT